MKKYLQTLLMLTNKEIEEPKLEVEEKKISIKASKKLLLYSACENDSKNSEAELSCKHRVSKSHLTEYTLRTILQEYSLEKKLYKHDCLCPICKSVSRLKILQLNCGCVVKNFEQKKKYSLTKENTNFGKCDKLSLIHICRCRRYAVCRSRWSPYH
eukprot:TRINITY_DN20829_c0_g1_i1.p1 TRINITY_DN20829_c0_g1~~TRINITY_DN20829_c0_g1_i1.p1  ORF type:complete len:156 (+),score=33.62 TRINITY_DN20829_c0_g1_i1:242-709(+)